MVGVSTSLGAQTALATQNRPAVEQAEVAKTQPVTRNENTPESARADAPSQAFQLSENAQGVIVQSSEGAKTERDSASRNLAEQIKTELVQFFTDLYHRDFGYTVADATRKAHRIVGKAESTLVDMAYNMTQRVDHAKMDQAELAYMLHVETMDLQSSNAAASGFKGADPEALLPQSADTGNDQQDYSQLRDTKVVMQLEARHQSGTPSFVEPASINLIEDDGRNVEPLIDLSADAWIAHITDGTNTGTLQLQLGRIVPLGMGGDGKADTESATAGSASEHYNVVT
jgi:hypothetical protein